MPVAFGGLGLHRGLARERLIIEVAVQVVVVARPEDVTRVGGGPVGHKRPVLYLDPQMPTALTLVTLPMAKARGFSAERQDAERLAGCPPELAGVRMDGQPTCDWNGPRLLYPLAACPAERREPSLGTMRPKALARRPPHTGSAPVRLPAV